MLPMMLLAHVPSVLCGSSDSGSPELAMSSERFTLSSPITAPLAQAPRLAAPSDCGAHAFEPGSAIPRTKLHISALLRIERVPEAVAEEVERHKRRHHQHARRHQQPRRAFHLVAAPRDEGAERGQRFAHAEPEK